MGMCFCSTGCGSNPMADPGVWPECHCWCHEKDRATCPDCGHTGLLVGPRSDRVLVHRCRPNQEAS